MHVYMTYINFCHTIVFSITKESSLYQIFANQLHFCDKNMHFKTNETVNCYSLCKNIIPCILKHVKQNSKEHIYDNVIIQSLHT